jgi:uncharacterized lipoprotein
LMRCANDGDPATFHREPEDEVSVLRYATACREIQGAKSSAHSVLPIKPYYRIPSTNASGNQSSTLPLQHPSLQIQLERVHEMKVSFTTMRSYLSGEASTPS